MNAENSDCITINHQDLEIKNVYAKMLRKYYSAITKRIMKDCITLKTSQNIPKTESTILSSTEIPSL
jgi:hypothetical protein